MNPFEFHPMVQTGLLIAGTASVCILYPLFMFATTSERGAAAKALPKDKILKLSSLGLGMTGILLGIHRFYRPIMFGIGWDIYQWDIFCRNYLIGPYWWHFWLGVVCAVSLMAMLHKRFRHSIVCASLGSLVWVFLVAYPHLQLLYLARTRNF